jgi:tetratricopeptide (TPR) repeat protein
MRIIGQGWSADPAAEGAIAANHAKSSLERDPNDPVALAIYGHVQSYLFRNYSVAADYLDRAMTAGPNCALAWGFSSLNRGYLGEHEKAVEHAEWALRLCPIGPDAGRFGHYLSQAYYVAGRYAEAASWGRTAATETPANTSNLRCLIASLVALGETKEAKHFAGRLLQLVPDFRLAGFRTRTPLPPAAAEVLADRLRRVGLPE